MKITSMAQIEEESELQWNRKTDFATAKFQVMEIMDTAIQLKKENHILYKALKAAWNESEQDKRTIRELEIKNNLLQCQANRIEFLEKRINALETTRSVVHHNHGCQNFYGDISESDF